ncbi:uncharacterized protein LOC110883138 [Helianthus annuus]|uniref:uncharacterized protein LOC110883138 n=1 Tax=Helianthus annuus TaxID=4232 RepID=UPI000B8F9D21|nr:uncharacterized protein LOC110883138 [Helianthus annuus]
MGKFVTKVGLQKRGVRVDSVVCSRYGFQDETSDHIFASCLLARVVWWHVFKWVRIPVLTECNSVSHITDHISGQIGAKTWKKTLQLVAFATFWRIWLARNDKEFNCKTTSVPRLVELIKEAAYVWVKNRRQLKAISWPDWLDFNVVSFL